jgi:hypothetical protein
MNRKAVISLFCSCFLILLFSVSSSFGSVDVLDPSQNSIDKKAEVLRDKNEFRYNITKGKVLKYKVTYRMNVWDDKQEKFVEDYSITGTLCLTMKDTNDKGQYLISVESLLESDLKSGKEMSSEGYDKASTEVILKSSGGVILNEEFDKELGISKYPEAHARVQRALGVLYPPLPGTTQDFEDGKSKCKGCSVSRAKDAKVENINEWFFIYQVREEKDMIIIEGSREDNHMGMKTKVESQFKDGIIIKGSMHYDRTIKDKIVLKCDMTVTLIEK